MSPVIEKEPVIPEDNKSELIALYNKLINKYEQSAYSDSSWKRFVKALNYGKLVIDSNNQSEKEIDFAIKHLIKAEDKLEFNK